MKPVLQVKNLVKRFGALTATNDISFDLHEGESLALIGPNGAGKTTIFSQIMGNCVRAKAAFIYMMKKSAISNQRRVLNAKCHAPTRCQGLLLN